MPITTIESLRDHLQWAMEVEHCTIPPYLCALYSLRPGHNAEAREVILSVFLEEMLHLTLAGNVLNAVGGKPQIDKPGFLRQYPLYLPHSSDAYMVPLSRFSPEALDIFMLIEKPEDGDALPEEDHYDTLGQFYQAIEEGLKTLCTTLGEAAVFTGDPARQIQPTTLDYDGGGRIVAVTDLASALKAIDEIEEQGEGLKHAEVWDGDRNIFHHEREEVAHYFRYQEIKLGRSYKRGDTPQSGPSGEKFTVDWDAVYPMRSNPRSGDYPEDSPIYAKMMEYNRAYSGLLRQLHTAFNGAPQQLAVAVGGMYQIRNMAIELMQMPSGDGVTTAGPAFEYVPADEPQAAKEKRQRIVIEKNGPYQVEGGVRLVRKSIVYSEHGEPLTWRVDEVIPTDETYRLCRCGQSKHKPFCDSSHLGNGFNGTETADSGPRANRAQAFPGTRIVMEDDTTLCADAGFCGNRIEKVWNLIERTDDSIVRFQLMSMCERCPSGRLTYKIDGQTIEPDLPREIAVTPDGPYWVTGGIPVERSDGKPLETRNRMTLCRCGHSNNKPLCDSTHAEIGWRENAPAQTPQ
ncbi:MAG: CDGSH iron-sulfur domain-containing protein [Chloroflexi bacterium]|nr:CDGSH iron-sulfur domain-containing protein [Chloroflexota bacterium]